MKFIAYTTKDALFVVGQQKGHLAGQRMESQLWLLEYEYVAEEATFVIRQILLSTLESNEAIIATTGSRNNG
jgi:hypothetical protein